MIIHKIVLAGAMSAMFLAAPAYAESGGTGFSTTLKSSASATQPAAETKAVKKAEQKPAKLEKAKVEKAKLEKAKLEKAKLDKKEKTAKAEKQKTVEVAVVTAPTELRSDTQERGLFSALFGGAPQMLPETRRRDEELRERDLKKGKKFKVKADFTPQVVDYGNSYSRGTIVVNTSEKYLYLVESSGKARRYAIAVGKDGLKFKGTGKIQDKQEWPRWIPTQDMQKRDPKKYGIYKDGMPGGPDNPLGARAMYLYQGKKDTHIRIHGTNQPWTIGTDSSNGCFRMVNEHVMDLYNRVRMGANVVVL